MPQLEDKELIMKDQNEILDSINTSQQNQSLQQYQYFLNRIQTLQSELKAQKQELVGKDIEISNLKENLESLREEKDTQDTIYMDQFKNIKKEVEIKQSEFES